MARAESKTINLLHDAMVPLCGKWIRDDAGQTYHEGSWWHLTDIEKNWFFDEKQLLSYDRLYFWIELHKWYVAVLFSCSYESGFPDSFQDIRMNIFDVNPATGEMTKLTGSDSKLIDELDLETVYCSLEKGVIESMVEKFIIVQHHFQRYDEISALNALQREKIKKTIDRLVRFQKSMKYNRKNRRQSKYSKTFQREINKEINHQKKLMNALKYVDINKVD